MLPWVNYEEFYNFTRLLFTLKTHMLLVKLLFSKFEFA